MEFSLKIKEQGFDLYTYLKDIMAKCELDLNNVPATTADDARYMVVGRTTIIKAIMKYHVKYSEEIKILIFYFIIYLENLSKRYLDNCCENCVIYSIKMT